MSVRTKNVINKTFTNSTAAGLFFSERNSFGKTYQFIYQLETEPGNVYYIDETFDTAILLNGSGGSGDIVDMIDEMEAANLEILTGDEKIPTNAGFIDLATIIAIVLDGLEIPPYVHYTEVVVVNVDADWTADMAGKLVVIESGITLSMPSGTVFANNDIVHIATKKIGSDASGKFQLKNGDAYAVNYYKDDTPARFEISSLFWSGGEEKFIPIVSNYHLDTDGLLKTTAKYFFDRSKYNETVGTATLVGGTVTVNTSFVTSGSIVQVSCINPSGTQGFLSAPSASIVNGVSFVINSSEASDTSTVMYRITKL